MQSVYLIRGNDGKYKIGIAKNPQKRVKQLQTGNSDILLLIETYQTENAHSVEWFLHNRFSHCRQSGEWFDFSISIESNFKEMCQMIDTSLKSIKDMGNPFI